jgi:hypothetical protein
MPIFYCLAGAAAAMLLTSIGVLFAAGWEVAWPPLVFACIAALAALGLRLAHVRSRRVTP